jgi:hypothetical protein
LAGNAGVTVAGRDDFGHSKPGFELRRFSVRAVSMSKRSRSQRDQPTDEVIQELFEQVRKVVDLAERLFLHFNQQPVARRQQEPPERDEPAPATAAPAQTERLAYTLKEVSDLVGVSSWKITVDDCKSPSPFVGADTDVTEVGVPVRLIVLEICRLPPGSMGSGMGG